MLNFITWVVKEDHQARLSLGLDNPTLVVPESTSKFAKDGTYSVDVDLWNASKDQPSMATRCNR